MPQTAFVLRIALRRLKPTVWREVLVSPASTLRELHAVIHAAMGWDDDHQYAFARPDGNKGFYQLDKSRLYEPPVDQDPWDIPGNNDATRTLGELFQAPRERLWIGCCRPSRACSPPWSTRKSQDSPKRSSSTSSPPRPLRKGARREAAQARAPRAPQLP